MGHVIDDVIIDVATVDVAVEVLVDTPVGVLTGLVVGEMVEAVATVVIDVVYTAFITLFSKHTDCDIDPDEPTNISVFRASDQTQEMPQSSRSNDVAPQNMKLMVVTLDTCQ